MQKFFGSWMFLYKRLLQVMANLLSSFNMRKLKMSTMILLKRGKISLSEIVKTNKDFVDTKNAN